MTFEPRRAVVTAGDSGIGRAIAVALADTDAGRFRFVPTVHPSSVLRTPSDARAQARADLVADLQVAGRLLQPE